MKTEETKRILEKMADVIGDKLTPNFFDSDDSCENSINNEDDVKRFRNAYESLYTEKEK